MKKIYENKKISKYFIQEKKEEKKSTQKKRINKEKLQKISLKKKINTVILRITKEKVKNNKKN